MTLSVSSYATKNKVVRKIVVGLGQGNLIFYAELVEVSPL